MSDKEEFSITEICAGLLRSGINAQTDFLLTYKEENIYLDFFVVGYLVPNDNNMKYIVKTPSLLKNNSTSLDVLEKREVIMSRLRDYISKRHYFPILTFEDY